MPAKQKHGGPRKGAGRKPAGRKAYLVRMKPEANARLRAAAIARGMSMSELLESFAL